MAIDYASTDSPDYTNPDAAASSSPGSSANVAIEIEQLNTLRQSLQQTTLSYFRQELSKTLPTDQVNRILGHKNVELELNRLIQRVSLESHSNIDSLSYKIARGLTQVAEPHVRLAVSLSTAGHGDIRAEDVLQDTIKNNANVQSSYHPLSDSLKPAAANSSVSKLYQKLESPLVNGPNHIPTLKPEVDKIVALGLSDADAAKQQHIAEDLHQDLLGEILTHQSTSPVNTNELVKTYLHKHGLDPNKIDSPSLDHFVEYVNKYQEVISADDQIAALQIAAEANNVSGENLQTILRQTGQSPEQLILEIKTTPPPPETAPPPPQSSSPTTPPPPLTPKQVDSAIDQADNHNYLDDSSQSSLGLRQVIQFIRRFINQQRSMQRGGDQLRQFFDFFRQNSVPSRGYSPNFGNILRRFSGSNGGRGVSSMANGLNGLGRSVGNFARSTLPKAANALGKLGSLAGKIGSKALLAAAANPWTWVAILAVLLLILLLAIVLPGSQTQLAANISPVGGMGGGDGGGGYCDPSQTPETCAAIPCEGSCRCPAEGYVTQGPGGSYSHRGVNAIDLGIVNGTPIHSMTAGVVSFAGFSQEGYGNLVIITHPDGTSIYYAHLDQYFVHNGQSVSVEQQIGVSDNTGNSTGPHLHLEYRGTGAQNILDLLGFSPQEQLTLENCSNNCGGIWCRN